MVRRVDVFFYGLFMDPDSLRAKGLDPTDIRHASVPGMALRLGDRASLIPDTAGCVRGMLMALSHAELDRLYSEASVSAYRPELVLAKRGDGSGVRRCASTCPRRYKPIETIRNVPADCRRLPGGWGCRKVTSGAFAEIPGIPTCEIAATRL
jgi:hypothetical protein